MKDLFQVLYWYRLEEEHGYDRENQSKVETDRYEKPSVSDTSRSQRLMVVEN